MSKVTRNEWGEEVTERHIECTECRSQSSVITSPHNDDTEYFCGKCEMETVHKYVKRLRAGR